MADASDILKASDALMRIVEDASKRSVARSRTLEDLKTGTPSEIADAKSTLEQEIASMIKLRAAIDKLESSMKNAEATLAKMETRAKKDQATLDTLAKSGGGGGGKELDEKSPFILGIHIGRDALAQKIKFASTDFTNLRNSLARDPNLRSHPNQNVGRVLTEKLTDVADTLEETERMIRSIDMA